MLCFVARPFLLFVDSILEAFEDECEVQSRRDTIPKDKKHRNIDEKAFKITPSLEISDIQEVRLVPSRSKLDKSMF